MSARIDTARRAVIRARYGDSNDAELGALLDLVKALEELLDEHQIAHTTPGLDEYEEQVEEASW